MTARALAARAFVVVVLVVAVVGGAILLSLDHADTAGDVARLNKGAIARNRSRIVGNERKDDRTRRCLTVAKHPQACLDRIAGAQGPGGATGRTGATGQRGLSATGKRGPTGPTGKPGRDAPAPTAERIAAGFDVWCSRMLCVGKDGTNGTNGADAPPVTREEVASVLRELCGGSCNGKDGKDAEPVTQDQVNATVMAICAAGGCPAPAGPQGPQGEQGPPGEPAPLPPCDAAAGYVCAPAPRP